MAAVPDPGQGIAAVSGDEPDERMDLPPVFRWGQVETKSIQPMQRYRNPDSGNSSYSSNANIIWYFETGGAAMLNTHEVYTTETMAITAANTDAGDTAQCMLDYNSDALIFQQQLTMNGSMVEDFNHLNMFCNVMDLTEGGSEYELNPNFHINIPVGAFAVTGPLAGPLAITPIYYGANNTVGLGPAGVTGFSQFNLCKSDNAWFGQSLYAPRQGSLLNTPQTVQIARHLKSFIAGIWSPQYLPLAFLNQIMITQLTENPLKCIRDVSYNTTTFVSPVVVPTWSYTLSNVRLHYTIVMVQDDIAAQIQKAYLKNSLPDFLHAIKTYTWQASTPIAATTNGNWTSMWTISATSADKLMFVFPRQGDFSRQESCSLSSFGGGFLYIQAKVNGQSIPANRIDTSNHAYEFYRQIAYSLGKDRFSTSNIPLPFNFASITGTASTGAAGALGLLTTPGVSNQDEWNALMGASAAANDAAVANRRQGCTIIVISLSDVRALSGQNIKGGVAIRGMNVSLEYQFSGAIGALNPYLFMMQDELLIYKGTTMATLQ